MAMAGLFRPQLSNASMFKLVSFLFWNWIYMMTYEHCKEKGPEWCSRVLTVLHGCVCIIIGYMQCNFPLNAYTLSRRIMLTQYSLMIWSWGYFTFDLLWCLVYWSENHVVLCHHAAAIITVTRYIQKQHTGCSFACSLLLLELTSPLLQARWFLKKEGYGKTTLYTVVELMYLVLFLFLRGVMGTYAMFVIMRSSFFDLEEKILSGSLYIVSLIFIYDIAGFIWYKYKKGIKAAGLRREYFYATQFILENEKKDEVVQTPPSYWRMPC